MVYKSFSYHDVRGHDEATGKLCIFLTVHIVEKSGIYSIIKSYDCYSEHASKLGLFVSADVFDCAEPFAFAFFHKRTISGTFSIYCFYFSLPDNSKIAFIPSRHSITAKECI